MKVLERHDLASARRLLPLIRVISSEVCERRQMLNELRNERMLAEQAAKISPEGFSIALAELDRAIRIEERGLDQAVGEFTDLDLDVRSLEPLVIHIPGRSAEGDVVFCWEEGKQFGDRAADISSQADERTLSRPRDRRRNGRRDSQEDLQGD